MTSLSYGRADGLYDSGGDDGFLIAFIAISFVAIRIALKVSAACSENAVMMRGLDCSSLSIRSTY